MLEPQRLIVAPFLLDLRDDHLRQEYEAIRLGSKAYAVLRGMRRVMGCVSPRPQHFPRIRWLRLGLVILIILLRGALMAQPHVPVRAPEFPEGMQWLNTDKPLRLADLRGKVVLLDFWTYC